MDTYWDKYHVDTATRPETLALQFLDVHEFNPFCSYTEMCDSVHRLGIRVSLKDFWRHRVDDPHGVLMYYEREDRSYEHDDALLVVSPPEGEGWYKGEALDTLPGIIYLQYTHSDDYRKYIIAFALWYFYALKDHVSDKPLGVMRGGPLKQGVEDMTPVEREAYNRVLLARRFAFELLLPEELVLPQLRQACTEEGASEDELHNRMQHLARLWHVPPQLLENRARTLGFLR